MRIPLPGYRHSTAPEFDPSFLCEIRARRRFPLGDALQTCGAAYDGLLGIPAACIKGEKMVNKEW